MITVNDVSLNFSGQTLFKHVDLKFTPGNCYGIIGANGAGKTTFLRILSGDLEPTTGEVVISKDQRMSVLKQDHFQYDQYTVLDTVIMGNQRLYDIMKEKDALYAKEDFTDADGVKASELEAEFADMDGWEAESDVSRLIQGLGLSEGILYSEMSTLTAKEKVKVLLAQALFGNKMYVGNYEFWYESSQMMQRLIRDQNKKKEEKIKELQEFVSRFSANKSKSKQATARRKLLDKLTVEEMPASSRRYPFVGFKMDREPGKEILAVEGLTKTVDGRKVLDNVSFRVNKGDKIAFVGEDEIATTTLFKILMEELEPDAGTFKWGTTITTSYFPLDNSAFFNDCDLNLVDWLGQYTADNAEEGTESFKRSFLGRMLFSGDDVYKPVKVLSGGEKVRCMLSRMMLFGSNALVLDQPTNHLDLESITAVNNGLIDFKGVVLFASHDHEFVQTIANRVMEFVDGKLIDKMCTYDEYIAGAREEMLARLKG